MSQSDRPVIGIDVGGSRKGFHAVALRSGRFQPKHFTEALDVMNWCLALDAQIIAIDCPCAWSLDRSSRFAERALQISGVTIQCFKTPTQGRAAGRAFYDWVFNGEKLYRSLLPHYQLFDDTNQRGTIVIETFPHAVVCALAGRVVRASPKATTRRRMLREQGYDDQPLKNIDFIDAALCALTAERFLLGRARWFGDNAEGFIVVPK